MATTLKSSVSRAAQKSPPARPAAPGFEPPSLLKLGIGEALAQAGDSKVEASALSALRQQWSFHSLFEIQRLIRLLASTSNVDAGNPDGKTRAKQFIGIVRTVLDKLDGTVDEARLTFLVRTGWHEGKDLTTRTQYPAGPGRGFLQMEPKAGFDAVERAELKSWLATFASAATITEAQLTDAAAPLKTATEWPAGNLVDESLRTYDLFAVLMARSYLSRVSAEIPGELNLQATYWERHWHRVTDATKKAKWLSDAKRLNKLLEWA